MHVAYLEAKRSIDDRSVNRRVWDAMVNIVRRGGPRSLRIAEVGAGTGTMLDRMREWGFFAAAREAGRSVTYHAWEVSTDSAQRLAERLAASQEIDSWNVFTHTVLDDAYGEAPYDVVVAHAVLDLFPPSDAVGMLTRLLGKEGVVYASIIFDGATFIEPVTDARTDEEVLRLYHRSMGGGFAREHLTALRDQGFSFVEAGGSDWVIPPRGAEARSDERVLLTTFLDMIEESVASLLERGVDTSLDRESLQWWIARRREQAQRGELLFIAHQLDLLARR